MTSKVLKKMSIKKMMLMTLLIISLSVCCILGFSLYFHTKDYAVSEAEKKIRNMLLEHTSLHLYIQRNTHPSIFNAMKSGEIEKDFYSPELLSSSFMIRNMHQYYNEEREKAGLPKWYYKLASKNPRNPVNKADNFESELIEKFNNNNEIKEYKDIIKKDGQRYLYYAMPFLRTGKACLKCHGNPDDAPKELTKRYGEKGGFLEKSNVIRAIISVKAPLENEFENANKIFLKLSIFSAIIILFFVVGGGAILLKFVTKPIINISENIRSDSYNIGEASHMMSSLSDSLTEKTSELAASVEETSSSLEEISSVAKINSTNANKANNLMKDVSRVVEKANISMKELTVSMDEINTAGEEIFKIIKTIDEIAFQTNLLALNAAVEAARAGESGTGFSVVAEEVRNLAIRSADAAGNTSKLIEGTMKKVREGSKFAKNTSANFSEAINNSRKVGGLLGEIAATSDEQSNGVEQINNAIYEVDKITQHNLTDAEKTASISEKLKNGAEKMKESSDRLAILASNKDNTSHS